MIIKELESERFQRFQEDSVRLVGVAYTELGEERGNRYTQIKMQEIDRLEKELNERIADLRFCLLILNKTRSLIERAE